ncbi:MAG: hypothetical protein P4K94_08965 [Terracidiphilus sp.]|nr:hypothetical protein [Terracidiphilus sp.]
MRKGIGYALLVAGVIALIVPQANLGLQELRWISRFTFPGEVMAGIGILGVAYYLLGNRASRSGGLQSER